MSGVIMDSPILRQGLYVLTRDVKNPHADRRRKHSFESIPVYSKGTVIFFRPGDPVGTFTGRVAGRRFDGLISCSKHNEPLWRELMNACDPAPDTLANVLVRARERASIVKAEEILGVLLDKGMVSICDIDHAAETYDRMDDNDLTAFHSRHGV